MDSGEKYGKTAEGTAAGTGKTKVFRRGTAKGAQVAKKWLGKELVCGMMEETLR